LMVASSAPLISASIISRLWPMVGGDEGAATTRFGFGYFGYGCWLLAAQTTPTFTSL